MHENERPSAVTPVDHLVTQHDPLATARRRGQVARHRLLEEAGGVLNAEQVARRLDTTAQEVEHSRRAGRLLGLPSRQGSYSYPAWQFTDEQVLVSVPLVLSEFGVKDVWMQAAFFVSGNARLDDASPLEELRRGNIDAVRRAARAYREQGAA